MTLPNDFTVTRKVVCNFGEKSYTVTLKASLCPYLWMYYRKGQPLDLFVQMEGGGRITFKGAGKVTYDDATADDVTALLNQIVLVPCAKCGRPAFDPTGTGTNRDGQCEACFRAELDAEFAEEEKKFQAKIAKEEAKLKKQGYLWKAAICVHPKNGGDDRMFDMYFKDEPTPAEIRAILKKKRSAVLDDFCISKL